MAADLPAWVAEHDAAALRLEQAALRDVAGPYRDLVATFGQDIAAQYVLLAGSLTNPLPDGTRIPMAQAVGRALGTMATGMLAELPGLIDRLLAAVRRALGLGAKQAATVSGLPLVVSSPSQALLDSIQALRTTVPQYVAAVQAWSGQILPATWDDMAVALAKANQPVMGTEATTRWATNKAVNEGSDGVADAAGAGRIWISERDACLTCRAYSGEVAGPGETFPAGLTFGGKSSVTVPIYSPPAHPHCRCRTKPYLGLNRAIGVDFSTALKREAQRSVLRGDSAYDSRRARLNAADLLLATGLVGTSKTAQERARRALATGTFPDRTAARRRTAR